MTNEQINIAIAEACGAKWMNRWCASHATLTFMEEGSEASNPDWSICSKDKENPMDKTIPDYCNDLNAMHEAEEILKGMNKAEFAVQLTKSAGKDWPDGKVAAGSFVHVHSTARQRAKAFLKAKGKWKEDQ